MIVQKGNRQLTIQETEKDIYLGKGYDLIDKNGKVIEHATNKTVPISKYNKVIEELEKLKKEQAQAPKETAKKEANK